MVDNEFVYRIAYSESREGLSVSFDQDRLRSVSCTLGTQTSAGIKYDGPGITEKLYIMETLENRFKQFMSQLPSVEVIDDIKLPLETNDKKKADYLYLDRKVILELKSLKNDPEFKVHKEMNKHRTREDYPLFYGKQDISKILKHLPDGEAIKQRLFYAISHSAKKSIRVANKQINSTKELFQCYNAYGILVLLNEALDILSPSILTKRISQMLCKKDEDGKYHYNQVDAVWVISENCFISTRDGSELMPSLTVYGPTCEQDQRLQILLCKLQKAWASFNGIPFITANDIKVNDIHFKTFKSEKGENRKIYRRSEIWEREYRKKPYLRSLSDEAVLAHGAKLRDIIGKLMLYKSGDTLLISPSHRGN